jgi:hypothetical protein
LGDYLIGDRVAAFEGGAAGSSHGLAGNPKKTRIHCQKLRTLLCLFCLRGARKAVHSAP